MNHTNQLFNGQKNNLPLSIVSIVFLAAIGVCIICNYAIQKTISWSLYPIGSLLFTWCFLFPMLKFKQHRIIWSAIVFSILVIPFLFLIEWASPSAGWMVPLGIPIILASLLFGWIAVLLLLKGKFHLWYKISVVFVLMVPLTIFINLWINRYVGSPYRTLDMIINTAFCVVAALICFFIGLMAKSKR